jgi:hypothetical protein
MASAQVRRFCRLSFGPLVNWPVSFELVELQ